MNRNDIASVITSYYEESERLGDNIIKAFSKKDDNRYAVHFFDFSEEFTKPEFDIDRYQEHLLQKDYYRYPGSLQWNFYLHLICENEEYSRLFESGVIPKIEGDRIFARKIVTTPEELIERINASKELSEIKDDDTKDIASIWKEVLVNNNFSVIYSDKSYVEVVDMIVHGKHLDYKEDESATTGEEVEEYYDFIDALRINDYRPFPQRKEYLFGKSNLIFGGNGTGKTSLLESIEYWMCGKNNRNPKTPDRSHNIEIKFSNTNNYLCNTGFAGNTYRKRDHHWYGNFGAKTNNIYANFSRFNFFNTDAAVKLELSIDTDIENALCNIFIGESASYIDERVKRLLPRLTTEHKLYSDKKTDIELSISEYERNFNDLKKQNAEVESIINIITERLNDIGWKLPISSLNNQNISEIYKYNGEIITDISTIISLTREVGITTKIQLKERLSILSVSIENINLQKVEIININKDKSLIDKKLNALNDLVKLLERAYLYSEKQAHEHIIGLEKKIREHSKNLQELRAFREQLFLNAPRESVVSADSIGQFIRNGKNELSSLSDNIFRKKKTLGEIKEANETIYTLISEIHSKTRELIANKPQLRKCPVCGAKYQKGELKNLLSSIEDQTEDNALKSVLDEIANEERKYKELTKIVEYIELIKDIYKKLDLQIDEEVAGIPNFEELIQLLDNEISKINANNSKMRDMQDSFQKLCLNETEFREIVNNLSLHFPDMDINDLDEIKMRLEKTRSEREENLTTHQKILKEHSNKKSELSEYIEKIGMDEQDLSSQKSDLDKALTLIQKADSYFYFDSTTEFSAYEMKLNYLYDLCRDYFNILTTDSSLSKQKEILSSQISEQKNKKVEVGKIIKRLQKAISILENIQTEHSKSKYLSDFLNSNIDEIQRIFKHIHSPNEYSDVMIVDNEISLKKKGSKKSQRLSEISSGQRSALALSIFLTLNRKLKHAPKLILLDDPVSHVDDLNIIAFFDYLREIVISGERQLFFATASRKSANLFKRKFDFIGEEFKDIRLERTFV